VKLYRVVISLEVDADGEEAAVQEAMSIVNDSSMVVESVSEVKQQEPP
jgi:hypothetical protein